MDFETYFGSLASTSFLPAPFDEIFTAFKNDAIVLFKKYTDKQIIKTKIRTTVQYGHLSHHASNFV